MDTGMNLSIEAERHKTSGHIRLKGNSLGGGCWSE